MQPSPDFNLSKESFGTPKSVLINTGEMIENSDMGGIPENMTESEFKLNEFVIYD
jgi:hypothetical protein